jgi:enamine deaminase RidA (YjgF/YER057c/UK114 family)
LRAESKRPCGGEWRSRLLFYHGRSRFGRDTINQEESRTMSDGGAPARFSSPGTMPRPYGYSQVVEITGGHPVYISGQVPLDTNNRVVGVGDFAAQTRQAFENVRLGLEFVGLTFAHVVKIQMFLTDIANLPAIRDIRDEFVNTEQPPASTTVQVAALFHPDVLFEIDAIAYAPGEVNQSAQ